MSNDENFPIPFGYTGANMIVAYDVGFDGNHFLVMERTMVPVDDVLAAPNIKDRNWYQTTLSYGPFDTEEEARYYQRHLTALWRQTVNQSLQQALEKEFEEDEPI